MTFEIDNLRCTWRSITFYVLYYAEHDDSIRNPCVEKVLCHHDFKILLIHWPLCGRHDLTHYFYSKPNHDGVFHHKVKLSFLQGVLISNVVLLILYQLFISYGYINNNVRRGDIRMALIAYIVVQNVFNLLTLYAGGRLCQLKMYWKITPVIISFLNNGLQRWIYYYRDDFVHKNTITCLVYVIAREGLQDSQCHRKQSYLFISKTHII